ncbi:MAG: hypothetical protein FJ395_13675 [Verrucomicrobia bacterium]|nr:hypothetical protein [Verrucomicrobiota bacterium]
MSRIQCFSVLSLAVAVLTATPVHAQQGRPYIGFAYPAGGQQGATFQIRLGGQGMDGVNEILVSGKGVTAKLIEYHWPMSPQDSRLLNEQMAALRRLRSRSPEVTNLMAKISYRLQNWVQQPHCRSISSLAYVEVTIAPDAPPGERELRLINSRGISNPLPFHVGQVPEHTRKPMKTAARQVLGKEQLALRNRPSEEAEVRINLPCTMNGQIASREVNSYRFAARKGQRLVITMLARQLIPYIADAAPGWFQPVLALYDAEGNEVAYEDDYRFKPDPVILFEVPKDGDYVLAVQDSIYRGREDFVYRVTIGELPFVTSIFPLGGRDGEPSSVKMKGWNLKGASLTTPAQGTGEGIHQVVAHRDQLLSNPMPFALDTLMEAFDKESNNSPARAQAVTLPVIINGRIDKADDWDVFQFNGKAGETVVVEVYARRLDSPLDSVVKLTDAKGKLIAFNDDCEDLATGLNTHHADSYFMAKLPADGVYYVHIGDTARHGGEEYGYRLRISAPRPDFALRVVPSSATAYRTAPPQKTKSKSSKGSSGGFRGGSATVSVYAIRKDGFTGPIKLGLKDSPKGFSSQTTTLRDGQDVVRFSFSADWSAPKKPVPLSIEGRATVGDKKIANKAMPAEDKMQAFLWRHLVPAKEFAVQSPTPSSQPTYKRVAPTLPSSTPSVASSSNEKSKFTKGQVAGRLRQLRRIYDDGLFTDEFYLAKVAECETGQ